MVKNTTKSFVDEIPMPEFFQQALEFFGTKGAARVIGWAALLGAVARDGDTMEDMRDRVIALGFSRTSVYDVVVELRLFRDHLERYHNDRLTPKEVVGKLRESVSLIGDNVVC